MKRGHENIVTRTRAELDLKDQDGVANFFAREKPDVVFLAAARVGGILANATYRGEFIYENLMIQTNVMHHAHLAGASRLLFLGSSCIYPKHAPQPMKEEHLMTGPLEPTNSPYAVAKIAGVEMCDAYNKQYGASFLPVMPTNLYGPGDNFDLETSHAMPALIRKFHLAKSAREGDGSALAGDEARFGPIPDDVRKDLGISPGENSKETVVPVWGSGKPRREFMHVDDMADACVHLALDTGSKELVNIGVGEDVSIAELASIIARVVGFEGEVAFDTSRPDGTPRKLLDVSRLFDTGWRPRIGLEQGIRDTYEWYLHETGARKGQSK
jgi:GDP-L-fucose synthase